MWDVSVSEFRIVGLLVLTCSVVMRQTLYELFTLEAIFCNRNWNREQWVLFSSRNTECIFMYWKIFLPEIPWEFCVVVLVGVLQFLLFCKWSFLFCYIFNLLFCCIEKLWIFFLHESFMRRFTEKKNSVWESAQNTKVLLSKLHRNSTPL